MATTRKTTARKSGTDQIAETLTNVLGGRRTAKKTTAKASPKPAARKSATAKPVAKKTTPAKKVVAKKSASNQDRPPRTFDNIDWTALQDKDPSELHVVFAKLITQRSEIEIDPKQVQAVLSMHPYFQKSPHNKKRSTYRPLDAAIVHQRSVHMVEAHKDAAVEIAGRTVAPRKRAAKTTTAKKTTTRKAS